MWNSQISNAPQKKMSERMDELLDEIYDWYERPCGSFIYDRVREDRKDVLKKLLKKGLVKRERISDGGIKNITLIIPVHPRTKEPKKETREPYKKRNASLDGMGLKRRKT